MLFLTFNESEIMERQTYMINNVEALYPRLDKPYRYDQSANQGKGSSVPCEAGAKGADYSVKFKMDTSQAKELGAAMLKAYNEAKEDNWPKFKVPFEKVDGDTVAFIGKAKLPAMFNDTPTDPPKHYDSENTKLEDGFQLTTGSTVNLYVELVPYNYQGSGVSLRLRGVQVIQLKEFVPPSPFTAQEGFTKGDAAPKDDIDSIFDTAEKPQAEEPVEEPVEEPKVRTKKKAEPSSEDDLSKLLDELDDFDG